MAGYSKTPLWKKLGYRAGLRAHVDGAPDGYLKLLDLPATVPVEWAASLEKGISFAHVFTTRASELKRKLAACRNRIDPDGAIWISWPKKASKMETDITEDTIRRL